MCILLAFILGGTLGFLVAGYAFAIGDEWEVPDEDPEEEQDEVHNQ